MHCITSTTVVFIVRMLLLLAQVLHFLAHNLSLRASEHVGLVDMGMLSMVILMLGWFHDP